jgi:iron complex outermembrane receptor protein
MHGTMLHVGLTLFGRSLACALVGGSPAFASVSETDFLDDVPVVLSASRLSQPVNEAPASVTVIDQDMIRASGFRDIPDLMRLVPGFVVSYTRDNSWAVGYHGVADSFSRRFQVLVDGRSIYNPAYGSVNWSDLPLVLDDIERIEVVRGPNAATYGANAFFAVINIITKTAAQTPGAFASLQYGEQDMAGATLRYGGSKDKLDYRLTLSSQSRNRFEKNVSDNGVPEAIYAATQNTIVNARAEYRLSETDELSAQFGLTRGDWQAGSLQHPEEPTQQNVGAQFVQVKFRRAFDADNEWMLQAYYSRDELASPHTTPLCFDKVKKQPTTCPGGVPMPPQFIDTGLDIAAGVDVLQTRANLEFQMNRRLAPDWRLSLGAQLQAESATSVRYFNTTDPLDGMLERTFFNLEWRVRPDLLLQGGAMLEHHYVTGIDLSPRVAANYTFAPNQTVRFNVSQAYRSPTLFEQHGNLAYSTTTGQLLTQVFAPALTRLGPERILSREIGYIGRLPTWGLQWDVKVFRDTVYDTLDTSGKPSRFINQGSFQLQGSDLQLGWQPTHDLRVNAQFSRVYIQATAGVDTDIPKSAPRNLFSMLVDYELGDGWQLSTGVYRSGRTKYLSAGDTTQAYTRWDARLAKRWKWQGREVEAALVGQDLGSSYSEFRNTNVFSQRVYGSLSCAW